MSALSFWLTVLSIKNFMPKTKEQYEAIKAERKKAILSGALYLFALQGYNSTTSDNISKYVQCSHGLLYHYFPTKEQLFEELFENVIKVKHREIIANVDITENPKYLLKDLLDAYLNALKNPNDEYACVIYLLLNIHLQKKYIPKPKNTDPNYKMYDLFFNAIENGKQQEVFYPNNTKEMLIAILAMLKGLSFTRINQGYKDFRCPSSDVISRMIMKS